MERVGHTAVADAAQALTSRHAFAGFARMWAVAVLAHVVGNGRNAALMDSPSVVRLSMLATGLVAVGVLLVPWRRSLLAAMAGLALVTAWLEAPFLPNHWQLAALVSILLLVSLTREDAWTFFASNARWILLAFYGIAALAKLNTDFFDPVVSCARHYANQSLGAVRLPTLGPDSSFAEVPGWASAAVELSVVPLLMGRRTRQLGVGVGVVFHLLISFDLDQHFYDFTAILFALFALFAGSAVLTRIGTLELGERQQAALLGVLAGLVYQAVYSGGSGVVQAFAFVVWVPVGCWLAYQLLRPHSDPPALTRPRGVGIALVVVVILIGALPYLGLRTATSWNMYANLRTHDGVSNHFLVREAATLALDGGDFVQILDTDDDSLVPYVEGRWLVPRANLRHYLAEHPSSTVTVLDNGDIAEHVGDDWGEKQGLLTRKFLFSRSVLPADDENVCQATFLPAG